MSRSPRLSAKNRRSSCPISCGLELLGDRWSLLIVRDLLRGMTRYGEFVAGPEGIPTNILADRLARLEEAGIISSAPYQENPRRYAYALTAQGRDLKPVLAAIGTWATRHVPGVVADKELQALLRG